MSDEDDDDSIENDNDDNYAYDNINDIMTTKEEEFEAGKTSESTSKGQLEFQCKQVKVFVGTWNLHAKDPSNESLHSFIPNKHFDIVAVGTEECGQSIQVAVIYDNKSKWEKQLEAHMGSMWVLLRTVTLNAIHLAVFAHTSLAIGVTDLRSSAVPTGIANMMGNKGGVAVSFNLGCTSFAFVNCHFHAHDDAVEERNADYFTINEKLELGQDKGQSISDTFDVLFWFGDLNYRVNGGRKMIDSLLNIQMYEVMQANDQLSLQMSKKNVFQAFQEADIGFLPTYKFDANTDIYDSSPKQRVPSWTDRVLWKTNPRVRCEQYDSVCSMRISDHRPVFANFVVECGSHDTIQYNHHHHAGDDCTENPACTLQ